MSIHTKSSSRAKRARERQEASVSAGRKLIVCHADGHFNTKVNPKDISEIIKRKEQFAWLDIQDPQESDIKLLRDEFNFHSLAIEDATKHHERPKIDTYEGYYFIVFYAISYDEAQACLTIQSLSLFIGANYLVSVHKGAIPAIEDTIKRWQSNEEQFDNDAGVLLYELFDSIVDDYFPVIDKLADRVDVIEEQIFERFKEEALQEVFSLKRDLLHMRRVVAPERDVLNILIRREVPIFERNTILYLQDVYDHIVRVTDSIDTYRDLLSSALDAFLSMQSNRLNQFLKILTIASVVLMSDALIAGIYGMNFDLEASPLNMPELRWYFGYPFAITLMFVVSVGLLLFFRWRKWL
jgi:magnesium transporter